MLRRVSGGGGGGSVERLVEVIVCTFYQEHLLACSKDVLA